MEKEYEKEINELKFELKQQELKYKELVKKYQRVSDELILLKAGKPIRRK